MTVWILIGLLDAVVLLGFRSLGGFGAAGDAFKEWGCASAGIGGRGRSSC